jgi:hypothetical protein
MEVFQENQFCNFNPLNAASTTSVEMDLLDERCMYKTQRVRES